MFCNASAKIINLLAVNYFTHCGFKYPISQISTLLKAWQYVFACWCENSDMYVIIDFFICACLIDNRETHSFGGKPSKIKKNKPTLLSHITELESIFRLYATQCMFYMKLSLNIKHDEL